MFASSGAQASAPADLRRLNIARILHFLRSHGPAARSEIAAATGLTKGSITGLAGFLISQGLVSEVNQTLRRGRPSPMLAIDGHDRAVLVLELTVDRFRLRACDLGERTLWERTAAHPGIKGDPEQVLQVGIELARESLAGLAAQRVRVEWVVVVVAAPVITTGHVPVSVDLGWRDVDVRGLITSALPEIADRLSIVADAWIGGWAEYQHLRRTVDPDLSHLLYLKSDTGIGGMQVADGRVVRGAHNLAFTPGHMVVDPAGAPCACGQRGCLVTIAGPEAVATAAGLGDILEREGVTSAVNALVASAQANEPAAIAALADAGAVLGRFIVMMIIASDPAVVVLGGYWAKVFEHLLPGVQDAVSGLPAEIWEVFPSSVFRPGALGADANLLGAADLAIGTVFDAIVSEASEIAG